MKPVLLLTLCLATVLQAAEPAATPAPTPPAAPVCKIAPADTAVSPAQQQITVELPKYDPAAAAASKPTVSAPHPDALELPKITVRPKTRPRLAPAAVITNKGLEEKLSPLDTKLLNKFTLPGWMGGQSAAERAREEERIKQKEALTSDVNAMATRRQPNMSQNIVTMSRALSV